MSETQFTDTNKISLLYQDYLGIVNTNIGVDENGMFGQNFKTNNYIFLSQIRDYEIETETNDFSHMSVYELDSSFQRNGKPEGASYELFHNNKSLHLTFYYRVKLDFIVNTFRRSWFKKINPSGGESQENNLLKDMIPFKWAGNGKNGSGILSRESDQIPFYTPILWTKDADGNFAPREMLSQNGGTWIQNSANGIIQFYGSTDNLEDINIYNSSDTSRSDPYLSFIKYTGTYGLSSSSGSSGISGGIFNFDLSAIKIIGKNNHKNVQITVTDVSNNILIGQDISSNDFSNQILIGNDISGHGNNTVVLGSRDCNAWHPPQTNRVDLGDLSFVFKDLYLSGNIYDDNGILREFGSNGSGFNQYFTDKPLAPVYISGGSFLPLNLTGFSSITTIIGSYDSSSGWYNLSNKAIELNWRLPPQIKSAYNFSYPRQLKYYSEVDEEIDLAVGSYKQDGFSNLMYNNLPYHQSLHIDVRYILDINTNTWSEWKEFSRTNTTDSSNIFLSLTKNNELGQFIFPTTTGARFYKSKANNIEAYYQKLNNNEIIYINKGSENTIFKYGGKYQFRIHLENLSEQNLDTSWNYLYIPPGITNDASYISLPNYGRATMPLKIYLTNLQIPSYYNINIFGANDNSNGNQDGIARAETSYNTLFSELSKEGAFVQYGFTLIQRDSDSENLKQAIKPSENLFNRINDFTTTNIQSRTWSLDNISGDNPFTDISNIYIYPGYTYDLSNYFMKFIDSFGSSSQTFLTEDISYPIIIKEPLRSDVTNDYNDYLDNSSKFISLSGATILNIYKKGNDSKLINNINIISNGNQYSYNELFKVKLSNTIYDNEFGIDLSGKDLCYFKIQNNINGISTITGNILKGDFSNNSEIFSISNEIITLIQSTAIDAVKGHNNYEYFNDIVRNKLRGWYLGVDISFIIDISRTNYDIRNNSYDPYTFSFEQIEVSSNTVLGFIKYILNITEALNTDISISNYNISQITNPSSYNQADFFGLYRPKNEIVSTFTLSGLFHNIDISLVPANNIITSYLKYTNIDTNISAGLPFEYNNNFSTQNLDLSLNLLLNYIKYDQSYSRTNSISGESQFYIKSIINNNLGLSSIDLSLLDISFQGKNLWWDFTWLDTYNNPNNNWKFHYNNTTYNIDLSNSFMNVGNGLYPEFNEVNTLYSHSQEISYNMMMWSNGGFRSGDLRGTDLSGNPFINYSNYYNYNLQSLIDYEIYDNSGIDLSSSFEDEQYIFDNIDKPPLFNTIIKFIVIKINTGDIIDLPNSYNLACNLIINSNDVPDLSLGYDYFLQIMEYTPGYTIYNGKNYSGWRNATKIVHSGKLIDNNSPCYTSISSNPYKISIYAYSAYKPILFFRIGLPCNSEYFIKKLDIKFGINP